MVVGGLLALAASPWGVLPARAAAPEGGVTSPNEGQVLTTMTPTILGQYRQPRVAGQAGRVDEVVVQLTGLAAQPIPGGGTFRQQGGGETVSFSWTTPRLTYNGPYQVTAQAKGTDGVDTDGQETSAPSVRRFSLRVPPATPAGFKATVESGSSVLLSWNANKEPDLVGYQVQRAKDGSTTYDEIGQTADETYHDSAPAPGDWRYRVVAVRAGANDSELAASNPSNPVAVTVTAPPPSTAGTSDGGTGAGDGPTGSGGAGSGGSGPGSGSGSAAPAGSGRAIATAGKVDLSGFAALLDNNRKAKPVEADPGFQEKLPFEAPTDELGSDEEEPGPKEAVDGSSFGLGQRPIASLDDDSDRRRSVALLAGGLLAFVLAMQVLWLKGQVDRGPGDLEALTPADGPPPGG